MRISSYFQFVEHARSEGEQMKQIKQLEASKLLLAQRVVDPAAVCHRVRSKGAGRRPSLCYGTRYEHDTGKVFLERFDPEEQVEKAFWDILDEVEPWIRPVQLAADTNSDSFWRAFAVLNSQLSFELDLPGANVVLTEGILQWLRAKLQDDSLLDNSLGALLDPSHDVTLINSGQLGSLAGFNLLLRSESSTKRKLWLTPPPAHFGNRYQALPPAAGLAFACTPAFGTLTVSQ